MTRDDFEFSDHVADQMAANGLLVSDVTAAIEHGTVIEDYPNAYPSPARLSLHWVGGRPIHVCWAQSPGSAKITVITAYYPDVDPKQRWEPDFKTRRKR